MFHSLNICDWAVICFQSVRSEEESFVAWEHCPILDKPSKQENSQKRAFIAVQCPQDSDNNSSKGICLIFFLYFIGPPFKLQCKETLGR